MWDSDTTMGGGGFMNEAKTQEGVGKSQKRGQNIVPLMIGHLTKDEIDLNVWGNEVRIVTTVAILKKIDQATTKITYELEDETGKMHYLFFVFLIHMVLLYLPGQILACYWLEAEKQKPEIPVQVNTYIRVHGILRNQDSKNFILILRIAPIMDLNELTSHLLEVIWYIAKAKILKDSKSGGSSNFADTTNPNDMEVDSVHGMKSEETTILKIIQAETHTEFGIERCDIKKKIPAHLISRLDNILEFLSQEGHIYTTQSEDHFKTT